MYYFYSVRRIALHRKDITSSNQPVPTSSLPIAAQSEAGHGAIKAIRRSDRKCQKRRATRSGIQSASPIQEFETWLFSAEFRSQTLLTGPSRRPHLIATDTQPAQFRPGRAPAYPSACRAKEKAPLDCNPAAAQGGRISKASGCRAAIQPLLQGMESTPSRIPARAPHGQGPSRKPHSAPDQQSRHR